MMGRNAKLRKQKRESKRADRFILKPWKNQVAIALEQYPYPLCGPVSGWESMAAESVAIDERIKLGWSVTEWQKAQKKLIDGILTMSDSDDVSLEGLESIVQAGRELHAIGGIQEMLSTCNLWVPRVFQQLVNVVWDGIGEWKA